jgi:hypothetical protein
MRLRIRSCNLFLSPSFVTVIILMTLLIHMLITSFAGADASHERHGWRGGQSRVDSGWLGPGWVLAPTVQQRGQPEGTKKKKKKGPVVRDLV